MPYYEVIKARIYAPGEFYCAGSGMSAGADSLADAERLFAVFTASPRYACAVELQENGNALKSYGPMSIEQAHQTMRRAPKRPAEPRAPFAMRR